VQIKSETLQPSPWASTRADGALAPTAIFAKIPILENPKTVLAHKALEHAPQINR
jgi:hypothetical protein